MKYVAVFDIPDDCSEYDKYAKIEIKGYRKDKPYTRIIQAEVNEAPRKRDATGAKKALEQTPCEDAVSRQAVLDLAETIQTDDYSGNEILNVIDVDDVKVLPPVTPTRKKGKWIKVTNGRGGHECNICYDYAPSYQNGDEYLSKYCPKCGAEMER